MTACYPPSRQTHLCCCTCLRVWKGGGQRARQGRGWRAAAAETGQARHAECSRDPEHPAAPRRCTLCTHCTPPTCRACDGQVPVALAPVPEARREPLAQREDLRPARGERRRRRRTHACFACGAREARGHGLPGSGWPLPAVHAHRSHPSPAARTHPHDGALPGVVPSPRVHALGHPLLALDQAQHAHRGVHHAGACVWGRRGAEEHQAQHGEPVRADGQSASGQPCCACTHEPCVQPARACGVHRVAAHAAGQDLKRLLPELLFREDCSEGEGVGV